MSMSHIMHTDKKPPVVWFAAAIPENSQGGVSRNMRAFSQKLDRYGFSTVNIYYPENPFWRNYISFSVYLALRMAAAFSSRPDFIVARSTDGAVCALLSGILRLRTRVILHNHGWEELVATVERQSVKPGEFHFPRTTLKAKLIRFPLLRLALRKSAGCVCGTIADMRWIRSKYPHIRTPLIYAPNGVVTGPSSYWHERKELPLEFLSVGQMTWRKNLTYILRVFSEINRRESRSLLYLVGCGAGNVEAQISKFDLTGIVIPVSSAPMDKMPDWYKKAPWFISASHYEGGHPLAMLEAMSFGCVSFVSGIDPHREVITDGVNGHIIGCHDPADDAGKILRAAADEKQVRNIQLAAWKSARKNSWERSAGRMARGLGRLK